MCLWDLTLELLSLREVRFKKIVMKERAEARKNCVKLFDENKSVALGTSCPRQPPVSLCILYSLRENTENKLEKK